MIGVGRTYAENYDTMLEFIDAKKGSKEVALIIQRNGERIYSTNEDVALPLASMAKILVAIEYANQLESGKIKKDELVPLSELEKYYVPHTDGGAHPDWLDKIKGNHVPLSEVVKGMIRYSSNANTDYLLTRLGFDNVNAVRDQLGLTNHDELAPFGASLYVSNVVQRAYQLSEEDTLEHMRRLSKEEYSAYTHKIHKAMSNPETFKKRNFAPLLSMDFQRVWSDRLPAATANDYIKVMTFLNEKNTYSPTTQKELDEVMEWLIPDQENHEWITHLGTKGGSTEFVLTDSVYVTDKQGNKTEIVLLTNDLTPYESNFLHENWDNFLFETLTNESFRNTLK
ncbi:serine hydrolase [Priestia taiwanensis]|uniref:D-alanyl-D-alanine carboxypeptidase n=1 Tax=Priestia taiwanensis TaxID=1347902 RepID=A0A917AS01_9BACI|nr:serine hydrolase [Priestia taiwanensis]MBM7363842.1 D-alanyl-D-alanine carboxypeptidase [Priestia taiwanensis]GGE69436.1 D-alanyl-D-alanine carboxypeptidase [Priestia taiwanensis]